MILQSSLCFFKRKIDAIIGNVIVTNSTAIAYVEQKLSYQLLKSIAYILIRHANTIVMYISDSILMNQLLNAFFLILL